MTDAFDLSAATIVNAPDVKTWKQTATITKVTFADGVSRMDFTGPNWPDVTPPGFAGPVQWTWWLFLRMHGQWVGSAFLLRWRGENRSGSPADPDVPSRYHQHWFYASRWRPMDSHGPIQPGEPIGMMVTAGAARDRTGPYLVEERSNVVVVNATDEGVFTFPTDPVDPPADPPPPPPSPPIDPASAEEIAHHLERFRVEQLDATRRIGDLQTRVEDLVKALAGLRAQVTALQGDWTHGLTGRLLGVNVTLKPPQ